VDGLVCPEFKIAVHCEHYAATRWGSPNGGTQPFEHQFAAGGSIIAVKMFQFQLSPPFMAGISWWW
jgi:hypothetical protein